MSMTRSTMATMTKPNVGLNEVWENALKSTSWVQSLGTLGSIMIGSARTPNAKQHLLGGVNVALLVGVGSVESTLILLTRYQ